MHTWAYTHTYKLTSRGDFKGWAYSSEDICTCLACVRPWAQHQAPQETDWLFRTQSSHVHWTLVKSYRWMDSQTSCPQAPTVNIVAISFSYSKSFTSSCPQPWFLYCQLTVKTKALKPQQNTHVVMWAYPLLGLFFLDFTHCVPFSSRNFYYRSHQLCSHSSCLPAATDSSSVTRGHERQVSGEVMEAVSDKKVQLGWRNPARVHSTATQTVAHKFSVYSWRTKERAHRLKAQRKERVWRWQCL